MFLNALFYKKLTKSTQRKYVTEIVLYFYFFYPYLNSFNVKLRAFYVNNYKDFTLEQ